MSKSLDERLGRVETILKEHMGPLHMLPRPYFHEQVEEFLGNPLLPHRLENYAERLGYPVGDFEAFERDKLKIVGRYFMDERQYRKAQEVFLLVVENAADVKDRAAAYLLSNAAFILDSYMDGRPFQGLQQLEQMMDKVVSASRSLWNEDLIDPKTHLYISKIGDKFKKEIREMHNS